MVNAEGLKKLIQESDVPYRELDSRTSNPRVHYQTISDFMRGYRGLKDAELQALEAAANAAIRARADKFNKMLAGVPAQFAAVGA